MIFHVAHDFNSWEMAFATLIGIAIGWLYGYVAGVRDAEADRDGHK